MKIKVYTKISNVFIWFFILGGLIASFLTIRANLNELNWTTLIVGVIFSVFLLIIGIKHKIKKNKGEFIEDIYECEKYEVLP